MQIPSSPLSATPVAVVPWRRPFHVWLDGIENGWAIPALLAAFVAVWMLYFSIAYIAGDLHPDVLEAWSLGRTLSWGSGKHPPLMGWFTHAWTLIFPTTDWSLELLAMVNAAVALWAVDLIARRYVRGDKRAIVILLLMLLPAYQFHAQRFNANTVLLAVWPLATYCFLRSFETRTLLWSAATGVLCAVAMLGKYYSVFLIAGFVVAAIAHPQRRAYLTSKAPWVSTIAGLIALAPHLHWLATTGAMPFQYAISEHSGWTFSGMLWEVAMFFAGIVGYLAIPAVALLLMIRADLRTFAANLRQLDSGLVLLAIIFAATIILPAIVAIILVTDLPPLWNLQGLFFAAIIAVCCTRFSIDRFDTVNLTVAVIALCFGAIAAAPFYASYRNTHPFEMRRNFLSLAANELTKRWEDTYDMPLKRISGSDPLAVAMAFYSPMHPAYSRPFRLQDQWPIPKRALQNGWAAMCFSDDGACLSWLQQVHDTAPSGRRIAFTVQSRLWGVPGVEAQVIALMVPPQAGRPAPPPSPLHEERPVEDFSSSRRAPF